MLTSQRVRSARTATFSAAQRPALNSTDTESKTCPPTPYPHRVTVKEIEQSALVWRSLAPGALAGERLPLWGNSEREASKLAS